MTGKQFKDWARTIHDDAIIQLRASSYTKDWEPLEPEKIRAELITSPSRSLESANNLEDCKL